MSAGLTLQPGTVRWHLTPPSRAVDSTSTPVLRAVVVTSGLLAPTAGGASFARCPRRVCPDLSLPTAERRREGPEEPKPAAGSGWVPAAYAAPTSDCIWPLGPAQLPASLTKSADSMATRVFPRHGPCSHPALQAEAGIDPGSRQAERLPPWTLFSKESPGGRIPPTLPSAPSPFRQDAPLPTASIWLDQYLPVLPIQTRRRM